MKLHKLLLGLLLAPMFFGCSALFDPSSGGDTVEKNPYRLKTTNVFMSTGIQTSKIEYFYQDERVTHSIYSVPSVDNSWFETRKDVYEYDGNKVTKFEFFKAESGDWEESNAYTYFEFEDGRLVKLTYDIFNGTDVQEYAYDGNALASMEFRKFTGANKDQEVMYNKHENVYQGGNLIESIVYYKDKLSILELSPYTKDSFIYNSDNLTKYVNYQYDMNTSEWKERNITEYTYTGGLMDSYVKSYWSDAENKWLVTFQADYEYNENNFVVRMENVYTESPSVNNRIHTYEYEEEKGNLKSFEDPQRIGIYQTSVL
ncbi:hypothetical protein [Aureibacter tunicatorum]|uniref:YD repeat-containing protein n=1 Tax=Aureibacter tunicatorum TaxID=866807 RepID=A0AAE3XSS2_9BACT|nr:hypothetical protein [Aureibacter tunicatorum]MDR6241335.1 hypothetical protein [Aureibacter tunicatorum]BDD03594.1 hypothetical protein AUTU_10770 [Aureibacter tunicatorum]